MAIERITPSNASEWRAFGPHHVQRYEFASRFSTGSSVLDLACGNGYGSFTLKNLGAGTVLGVDLDADAVAYARENYCRAGLEFQCMDAFALTPKAGGYDLIVSFETVEHLDSPARFLAKLRSLVSDAGRLVISAPNTLRYQRAAIPVENPFHLSEPTYADLKTWLEPYFIVDQEWEQSPVTPGFDRAAFLFGTSAVGRCLVAMERFAKRALGRPSVAMVDRRLALLEEALWVNTGMFPLLPERREAADVFVFVCRPRG